MAHIRSQIAHAEHLLSVWGTADILETVTESSNDKERPLWDAENPPLTRRDLFRLAAWQGQMAVARAMSVDHLPGKSQPGRDHQRIASAIQHLMEASQPNSDLSLVGVGFASLSVSEECTACNACTRACPTAALTLEMNEDESHYWLKFTPTNCIGCEVCVHVCVPQALVVEHAPTLTQVFASKEAHLLSDGELARCEKCNASFAAHAGVRLCPTCEHRRRNPFGSKIPPGSNAQRDSIGEVRHDH
jgi:ferredoxin